MNEVIAAGFWTGMDERRAKWWQVLCYFDGERPVVGSQSEPGARFVGIDEENWDWVFLS